MKTWQSGASDKIRVDSKRIPYKPLKGLYAALVANSLNILVGIGVLVGYIFATGFEIPDPSKVSIPEWGATLLGSVRYPASPDWAAQLFSVCKTIAAFIESMYNGIIASFFRFSPVIYLLIVLPALFACTLGYYLGLKERKLFSGSTTSGNSSTGSTGAPIRQNALKNQVDTTGSQDLEGSEGEED